MDIKKTLEGKVIKLVTSGDNDFDKSIKLTLDDGTKFTIYAHQFLGAPCLNYTSMKINRNKNKANA